MYKIYFNNKSLYIVDQISGDLNTYIHQIDTIFIDELSSHAVRTMIYEMEQPEYYRGIYLYKDVNAVLAFFKKELKLVQAAGGFIYSSQQKFLVIFRRGKWDLPKGKLDSGETLEQCALREIEEETGLSEAKLKGLLCITYHTYQEKGKHILKETFWYLMKSDLEPNLTPQLEEGIEKCIWIATDQIEILKNNTHASIIDVLNQGIKKIL